MALALSIPAVVLGQLAVRILVHSYSKLHCPMFERRYLAGDLAKLRINSRRVR
jgi:hypothetical protein